MDSSIKHLLSLGREHFGRNDYSAAETALRTCVEREPELADVHFMLGVIHHDRGDLVGAKAFFERALEINGDYTEAALSLAVTCNELGRYSEGREVSARISRRSHSSDRIDPFARGKLANMHADVARAYEELGLFPEAADEYERALALCPSFSDIRTRRAAVLRTMGENDRAVRELDVALLDAPEYVAAHVSRGVSLLALGRTAEARAAFARAVELEPRSRAAKAYLRLIDRPGDGHRGTVIPAPDSDVELLDLTVLDD